MVGRSHESPLSSPRRSGRRYSSSRSPRNDRVLHSSSRSPYEETGWRPWERHHSREYTGARNSPYSDNRFKADDRFKGEDHFRGDHRNGRAQRPYSANLDRPYRSRCPAGGRSPSRENPHDWKRRTREHASPRKRWPNSTTRERCLSHSSSEEETQNHSWRSHGRHNQCEGNVGSTDYTPRFEGRISETLQSNNITDSLNFRLSESSSPQLQAQALTSPQNPASSDQKEKVQQSTCEPFRNDNEELPLSLVSPSSPYIPKKRAPCNELCKVEQKSSADLIHPKIENAKAEVNEESSLSAVSKKNYVETQEESQNLVTASEVSKQSCNKVKDDGILLPLDTDLLRKELVLRLQLGFRNQRYTNSRLIEKVKQGETQIEVLRQVIIILLEKLNKFTSGTMGFTKEQLNLLVENDDVSSIEITKSSTEEVQLTEIEKHGRPPKRRRMDNTELFSDVSTSKVYSGAKFEESLPHSSESSSETQSHIASEKTSPEPEGASSASKLEIPNSTSLHQIICEIDQRCSTIDSWLASLVSNGVLIIEQGKEREESIMQLFDALARTSTSSQSDIEFAPHEASIDDRESSHDGMSIKRVKEFEKNKERVRFLVDAYSKLKTDYSTLKKEKALLEVSLERQKQKMGLYLSRDPDVWELELPILRELSLKITQSERSLFTDEEFLVLSQSPDGQIASMAKQKRLIRFLRTQNAQKDKTLLEAKQSIGLLQRQLKENSNQLETSSSRRSLFSHSPTDDITVHQLQQKHITEKRAMEMETAALTAKIHANSTNFCQQLAESEKRFNTRQVELEEALKEEKESKVILNEKIFDFETEVSTLKKKVEMLTTELKEARQENDEVVAKVAEMSQLLTEHREDQKATLDTTNLPTAAEDLRTICAKLIRQRDAVTKDLVEVQKVLDERIKETRGLSTKIKDLALERLSLSADAREYQRTAKYMEDQAIIATAKVEQIKDELAIARRERDEARKESTARLEEQAKIIERASQDAEERAQLNARIDQYDEKMRLLKVQIDQGIRNKQALEDRVKQRNDEIDKLSDELINSRYPSGGTNDALPPLEFQSQLLERRRKQLETDQAFPASENIVKKLKLIEDECNAYRTKLLCSLCNEAFKNCLIKKCGHLFCEGCLQKTLSTRNRKCPQCNHKFQNDDIIKVFI